MINSHYPFFRSLALLGILGIYSSLSMASPPQLPAESKSNEAIHELNEETRQSLYSSGTGAQNRRREKRSNVILSTGRTRQTVDDLAHLRLKEGKSNEALNYLKEKHTLSESYKIIGNHYEAESTPPLLKQAAKWYEKSAKEGDYTAHYKAAQTYQEQARKDLLEARKYLEAYVKESHASAKANSNDRKTALLNLAEMYEKGLGGEKLTGEAQFLKHGASIEKEAQNKPHPPSQLSPVSNYITLYKTALTYQSQARKHLEEYVQKSQKDLKTDPKTQEERAELLNLYANQKEALLNLAEMYEKGIGGEKLTSEARFLRQGIEESEEAKKALLGKVLPPSQPNKGNPPSPGKNRVLYQQDFGDSDTSED